MNTTHITATNARIITAVRSAGGDFYATRRATARFCTEALADAAASLFVPAKYHGGLPTWRTATRDEAIQRLCAWASSERVRELVEELDRARQAAIIEFPAAIAELGAAL